MRIALDTNVLLYAQGINDATRRDVALELIARVPSGAIVIPAQALAEFFNVLVRKTRNTPIQARDACLWWSDGFPIVPTTDEILTIAIDLAADHSLNIWDAIIFGAAVSADCRVLLSEDLQHDFTWGGVTVVNPFASEMHPLLVGFNDPSDLYEVET